MLHVWDYAKLKFHLIKEIIATCNVPFVTTSGQEAKESDII